MATFRIPVPPLLPITTRMGQAKIQQHIVATERSWVDMLDIGPEAGPGIEVEPPVADRHFPCQRPASSAKVLSVSAMRFIRSTVRMEVQS